MEIEIGVPILNRDFYLSEVEIAFFFSRFSVLDRDRGRVIEDRDFWNSYLPSQLTASTIVYGNPVLLATACTHEQYSRQQTTYHKRKQVLIVVFRARHS